MKSFYLFCCMFLLFSSVNAQTNSAQNDAEITPFINVKNTFELLEKHKQHKYNLSPFVSLLAQIDLAQHFNKEREGAYLIDSFLTHYYQYYKQSEFLQNFPSSEVVRVAKDCSVSVTQYENQRMHIPLKVNETVLENCIFDTGAC